VEAIATGLTRPKQATIIIIITSHDQTRSVRSSDESPRLAGLARIPSVTIVPAVLDEKRADRIRNNLMYLSGSVGRGLTDIGLALGQHGWGSPRQTIADGGAERRSEAGHSRERWRREAMIGAPGLLDRFESPLDSVPMLEEERTLPAEQKAFMRHRICAQVDLPNGGARPC
jgi:hypothetical protein